VVSCYQIHSRGVNHLKLTKVIEFVGGVSPDATQTILKHGVDKAVNDVTINPGRTSQIVKRVILGGENIPEERIFARNKGAFGLENGKLIFANSIKEVNDDFFDDLIKAHSGLPQETLDLVKKYPMKAIENPNNFNPGQSYNLANKILSRAESSLDDLGSDIVKVENAALATKGRNPFGISDLHAELKSLVNKTGLTTGIKQTGRSRIAGPKNIPGYKDLKEILGFMESKVIDKSSKEIGKIKPVDFISLNQASKMSKWVDLQVDKIARNKTVSPQIKSSAFEFAKKFRERYQTMLGLTEEKAAYSEMKQILFDSQLDRVNAVQTLKNRISSYAMTPVNERAGLDAFLSKIDNSGGLVKEIELSNLGKQLSEFDLRKTMQGFETVLNSPEFISQSSDSIRERFYRAVDSSLKKSAPKRVFVDDAEMSLAAKELLDRRANVMRVNTVGSMLNKITLGGLGAAAGSMFGPLGSATGIAGAMALTSKGGTKGMLKLAERMNKPMAQKAASSGVKKSLSDMLGATQAGLFSASQRKNQKK